MRISLNGVLLEIWAGGSIGLWSEVCSLSLLSQLEECRADEPRQTNYLEAAS